MLFNTECLNGSRFYFSSRYCIVWASCVTIERINVIQWCTAAEAEKNKQTEKQPLNYHLDLTKGMNDE